MTNKSLFFLLLLLLGITYYWQEYRVLENKLAEEKRSQVIDLEGVIEVSLPNLTLLKKGVEWRIKEQVFKTSQKEVAALFKTLQQIKFIKAIPLTSSSKENLKEFLGERPIEFSLRKEGKRFLYILGSRPSVTGRFYLLVQEEESEKLYLCESVKVIDKVYRSDEENFKQRFYDLYKLISSQKLSFLERKVFEANFWDGFNLVSFENMRNKSFDLDFINYQTIPSAPQGLQNNKRYFLNYLQELKNLEFDKIHLKKGHLKNSLSKIKWGSKEIELFGNFDNQEGRFLFYTGSNFVYEFAEFKTYLFFQNVQHFWDKRIHFELENDSIHLLHFEMTFFEPNKKTYSFQILNKEKFEVRLMNHPSLNMDRDKFLHLMKILFAVDDYSQANFVSEQSQGQLQGRRKFQLSVLEKKIDFYQKEKEILLHSLTDGYVLHYSMNKRENWGSSLEEFTLKK